MRHLKKTNRSKNISLGNGVEERVGDLPGGSGDADSDWRRHDSLGFGLRALLGEFGSKDFKKCFHESSRFLKFQKEINNGSSRV